MTKSGGSVAVLIGAIVGVTAALARRGDETPPILPAENRSQPALAEREAPPAPSLPEAAPLASGEPVATSEPPTTMAAVPLAVASAARRLPAPAPIASAGELKATEIRCYEQDPVACRRAADAYATGSVVPRDDARAQTYRKVEITQLVRLCEKNRPRACLGLADLYDAGDGIAKDTRRAEQLSEHARNLCRRRPSEDCRSLALP